MLSYKTSRCMITPVRLFLVTNAGNHKNGSRSSAIMLCKFIIISRDSLYLHLISSSVYVSKGWVLSRNILSLCRLCPSRIRIRTNCITNLSLFHNREKDVSTSHHYYTKYSQNLLAQPSFCCTTLGPANSRWQTVLFAIPWQRFVISWQIKSFMHAYFA